MSGLNPASGSIRRAATSLRLPAGPSPVGGPSCRQARFGRSRRAALDPILEFVDAVQFDIDPAEVDVEDRHGQPGRCQGQPEQSAGSPDGDRNVAP